MGHHNGLVSEIRLEASGQIEAYIACPIAAIPKVGQYLMASDLDEPEEVLGTALFITERTVHGFWAAPPIPNSWKPGTSLDLVGPLGHGFELPREVQRLEMVALDDTISRLMPLVGQLGGAHGAITLFTDLPLPRMPASLEAYPMSSLAEAIDWPDFMVIDLPLHHLPELRDVLGFLDGTGLNCPAQALVTTPMPCVGLARCGLCAIPARRGWRFACEDGPVFDLNQLKW